MAGFSAGIYTRFYNWVNDRNNSVHVTASRMDAEMDGFATGLSQAILKDGTQTITADVPWNGRRITGLGLATAGGDALSRDAGDARYPQLATASPANTLRGNPTGSSATLTDITLDASLTFNAGALKVVYGTTSTSAAAGNDTRIVGAAQKAANLGDLADIAAAKTTLGINNVNNTSDAAKPVSTAQQTALDAKLPKDGSQAMTGALTLVSASKASAASGNVTFGLTSGATTRSVQFDGATAVGFTTSTGAWACYVDNSGNFTATGNVTAFSDERLKADISTISCALELVRQLRGVAYTRISTGAEEIGVIAQEVADVFPEVVLEHEDGILSVNYGALVAPLIEAVKVLADRVEALEAGR